VLHKIRLSAVAIAFIGELGLDQILSAILLNAFGHDDFSPGMSELEKQAFIDAVWRDDGFVFSALVFGSMTTILGGYLCARIAKTFPYYNGLAIGIVGLLFVIVMGSGGAPWWYTAIGFLMPIPGSLYGAHLAKLHMNATGTPPSDA
jgi:hypothetical protein